MKSGFFTPIGLFYWFHVPFGVYNGPLHFHRRTNLALVDAHLSNKATVFIDDFVTGGYNYLNAADRFDRLLASLEAKA